MEFVISKMNYAWDILEEFGPINSKSIDSTMDSNFLSS